ncbi:MAG TPA: hypothetical protein VH088_15845 [Terriglobales bacterium]|nr:hypothetical protein [Terriglobales bacterium]
MSPLMLVLVLSVVIGFLMVVVFRYTSDQKAIGRAKDQLKAHLLAVRLFQDQLPVVMRAYARIFGGTARYLRLAFMPFLVSLLPITFLIIQVDRYLGSKPLGIDQPFLVEARVSDADTLGNVDLQLPSGLKTSAPAVHIPKDKEAVWRVVAERDGQYDIQVAASGQTVSKHVVVAQGVARLSPIRLRGQFWERLLSSSEAALPKAGAIQSIAVNYPPREIHFGWWEWNWIVLFFVVSLIAGFIFKTVLGIQV